MRNAGPSADEATVRAAGGVVWRAAAGTAPDKADKADKADEAVEIVIIHRPRYGDWSLPKGKLEKGESFEQAAVREVEEETGLIVDLGPELPAITYRDRLGRSKVVRYWSMVVRRTTTFVPNDEVDEVRWIPAGDARGRLSYETDVEVLDAFLAVSR